MVSGILQAAGANWMGRHRRRGRPFGPWGRGKMSREAAMAVRFMASFEPITIASKTVANRFHEESHA